MLQNKEKQVKKSIGFYPDILQRIDEEAERQHRSRSNMIDVILREHFNIKIEEETRTPRPLAR